MERLYNARAGFTAGDDRLPAFFYDDKLPPHNVVFTVSDEDLDLGLRLRAGDREADGPPVACRLGEAGPRLTRRGPASPTLVTNLT